MIKHAKDILMYKVSKKAEMYNEEEKSKIAEISEKTSKEEIINIIYKLSETENKMKISTQKTIIFETEIIKLCIKMDTASIEDRISNLEKKIQSGNVQIDTNKTYQIPKETLKNSSNKITEPQTNIESTEKKENPKIRKEEIQQEPIQLSEGTVIKEWKNVINNIKEQGKVMLYANLLNTEAIIANDMTIVIRFNNGLNKFKEDLFKQSENMNILNKEIAMICKKPMQIKLEDAKIMKASPKKVKEKQEPIKQEEPEDVLEGLDIQINYIEEE